MDFPFKYHLYAQVTWSKENPFNQKACLTTPFLPLSAVSINVNQELQRFLEFLIRFSFSRPITKFAQRASRMYRFNANCKWGLASRKIKSTLEACETKSRGFDNRARITKSKSQIEASEATTKGFEVEHHQQNLDLISIAKLKHKQQNADLKLKHVKLKRPNVDVIEHVEAQQLDLSALIKSWIKSTRVTTSKGNSDWNYR